MAPNAAASGKITRHRLNRGGDYQSNLALYLLAVGRMRRDSSVGSGHTKPKINTCLKRYIAPGAGLTGSAPKTSVGDRLDGERLANWFAA